MSDARAFAKINLGLVVGPRREDGKHELVTVLQRINLHDDIVLDVADELTIEGFAADTIVRAALQALAIAARVEPRWIVRIGKHIPIAAGLGGGSADAAAALRLANATLTDPLPLDALHRVAASVGADVPFFLYEGAQLATADGSTLAALTLPADYHVVLLVPDEYAKRSTGAVYDSFDLRSGAEGFDRRVQDFHAALASVANARDLAAFPPNDLASSPLSAELQRAGAFRADVSGAGPTVYGLFEQAADARQAADMLAGAGTTFVARPI